jgi:hypothetical protein
VSAELVPGKRVASRFPGWKALSVLFRSQATLRTANSNGGETGFQEAGKPTCLRKKRQAPKARITNKLQIPSAKLQTSPCVAFGHLGFGTWNLFGIWCLELGFLAKQITVFWE